MYNCEISILTPVHIGSGQFIQGNAEYVWFANHRQIAVVDEAKVLSLIGVEQLPIWMRFIEQPDQSFLAYLLQRKPDLQPADIALRVLNLTGTAVPRPVNTLREQIHTGMGKPLLPGSSIKGAIRTALFAKQMIANYRDPGLSDQMLAPRRSRGRRDSWSDTQLSQRFFGDSPNQDGLRLLQVGDFQFSGSTCATFSETLNRQRPNSDELRLKSSVRQMFEYLPPRAIASGQIRINHIQQKMIRKTTSRGRRLQMPKLRLELSLEQLIKDINNQTAALIDNECRTMAYADFPEDTSSYLEKLQEILQLTENCGPNEAILRLGWGTGFHTMTGDWVHDVLNDRQLDKLSRIVRGKGYEDFPLPKSRKVLADGTPLGFISLKWN